MRQDTESGGTSAGSPAGCVKSKAGPLSGCSSAEAAASRRWLISFGSQSGEGRARAVIESLLLRI
jgi:hypothetical protein